MSASSNLAHAPAAACTGVPAGELPVGAASAPAEPVGRPGACRMGGAEIEQVGELLDALLRESVKVSVRDGALVVEGEPRTMFGHAALETLRGREQAVVKAAALAYERGPAFVAARHERKPRASRARAAAPAAATEMNT